jgi:hypothetical protein
MNASVIYSAGWTSRGLSGLVLVMAWLTVAVGGAQTNAPTAQIATNVELATISKSIFVDEFQKGKDPFFPNSMRRQPGRPTDAAALIATTLPASEFKLKGITGPANRRFALINNRDFEVGEKGSVYVGGKKVTIKCEKIGPRSVWITIESQPGLKELRLPGD